MYSTIMIPVDLEHTKQLEKAIATAYEIRFRPEEKRHAPWVERYTEQAQGNTEYNNNCQVGGKIKANTFHDLIYSFYVTFITMI